MRKVVSVVITLIFMSFSGGQVSAGAVLYFDEGSETVVDYTHSVGLFIDTNGATVTAMQAIITLPDTYLSYENILFADYPNPEFSPGQKPNCIHSLLPPEWGLTNKTSPYVNDNTLYITCGFSNPGYTTQGATGDKLATITFDAFLVGADQMTLDNTNTKFYYVGNEVAKDSTTAYQIEVLDAIEPTPGPSTIPERATDSISEGDLNFVEINGSSQGTSAQTGTSQTGQSGDLEVVEQDNSIPAPPNLPERDTPPSLLDRLRGNTGDTQNSGEVLSAQSLRELLIPGKSDADRRVVVVNLISLSIFLLVLGVLVWQFIRIKRQNKIKSTHLSELLESELATIESKLGGIVKDKEASLEISQSIEKISKELKDK